MNQKQSISEIKNKSYKSLLTYSYSSKHKLLALEEVKSKKNYIADSGQNPLKSEKICIFT